MEIYVVESHRPVLDHPGGQSHGVPAMGWTGEGVLYLHLLAMTDDQPELVEIDQVFHRFGPREGHWWVCEGEDAHAHWPGVVALRARCVRRRLVPMRALLEAALRSGPSTRGGRGTTAKAPSGQTATTPAKSSTGAGAGKEKSGTSAASKSSDASAKKASASKSDAKPSSKASSSKSGATASKSGAGSAKSGASSSGKSKSSAKPSSGSRQDGSSTKSSQKPAAGSNGATAAASTSNGTAGRVSTSKSGGSRKGKSGKSS